MFDKNDLYYLYGLHDLHYLYGLHDLHPHLESVLTGRYIGFIQNLLKTKKPILTLLFASCSSAQNSLTGQNIEYLCKKFIKRTLQFLIDDKDSIKFSKVYPIRPDNSWKVNIIEEISLVKKELLEVDFEEDELEIILDYICTSWLCWLVVMGVDITGYQN